MSILLNQQSRDRQGATCVIPTLPHGRSLTVAALLAIAIAAVTLTATRTAGAEIPPKQDQPEPTGVETPSTTQTTSNPQKLAQEAEAKGDLKTAMTYYEKICIRMAHNHEPGADALFTKMGDMAMTLSATPAATDEAGEMYAKALVYWNLAQQQNPRYLPAQEKLAEEYYKIAMFFRAPTYWTKLADTAKLLTEMDPEYANGHTYLATAKLHQNPAEYHKFSEELK
ncbi:MAG: hypothetical protein FWD61_01795 [Phycisphaerales bacterium]|nr:hypothetical protein [Phycisphaerales bacterium]